MLRGRGWLRASAAAVAVSALLAGALGMEGCVHGYGGCLFVAPVKHTLSGRVHFRSYPSASGIDQVPVLALDHDAYIYSPAQSFMCIATDELQLEGISEFPEQVVEGSHVSVQGNITAATASGDHTRFLMHVITLLPDNAGQAAESPRSTEEKR